MNPSIEKILKLPKAQKVLILVAAVALEGVVFYFPLYGPALEKHKGLQAKLRAVQEEVRKDREIANNLPKYQANYESLKKDLEQALTELPEQKEIPSLLISITHAGKVAGLDFLVFKPKPEVIKDFYAEVPVDITVWGSFAQVGNFFNGVGKLPRIVNINEVIIADVKPDGNRIAVKVTCTATTFRFVSKEEAAKKKEVKKK
jgi:type IV pilus assembly protein PilO